MVPCGSCFDFSLVNEMALVVGVPKIWLCKGQSPRMAHRQSSTAFTSVILRSVEQKKTVTEGGELVRVEEGDPGKLARRLLFMQRRV